MIIDRFNKKISTRVFLIQIILCSAVLLSVTGCWQNNKSDQNREITHEVFKAPQVTILSQLPDSNRPTTILLEDAPKPVVIELASVRNGMGLAKSTSAAKKVQQALMPQTYILSKKNTSTAIPADAQGKGFFTTYTTDDGLALDQVYCSFKDKWGNLWFGTNGGGVSKYDGKNFTNYTTSQGLANNVVWCITQDRAGNMWFGTDGGGASKYDGARFTNYSKGKGLPDNVVFSIMPDSNGNLWFGTLKGGVSKFDGQKFINYSTAEGLAGNAVKSIMEDHNGNFWFGTLGGGVSRYDGKNFSNYTTEQGLAKNGVWSMAEDTLGDLWFGTEGNGLSRFDGETFTTYDTKNGLADNVILSMATDGRGNIWFGTLKGGVSKYDGKAFTNYTSSQGLANNTVRTITRDEKGNLWFGTYGGGLSKYAGNSFANFTIEQGLPNNVVFSITEDVSGNLWLGTAGGGVSKYDRNNFINYTKSQGVADNVIYSIAKDKEGNLWFGTSGGGVSKFDGKSFTNFSTIQGLANNIIFSIIQDKIGNLWFGTSGGGVSKYDGKSFTNYTTLQGLANNVVFSIKEDKAGNLWFGTLGGGVSRFDGNSFTNYTTEQGLANNVVWTIADDEQGNLWFGTQQGLSLMDKKKADQIFQNHAQKDTLSGKLFTSFTTRDGLPDNFITQVVRGDGGKLYIGTNLGMCELISTKSVNEAQKSWAVGRIFNSQKGYPIKDVNAGLGAMFKDSKGIIWIGTGSDKTGLVRFDPNAVMTNNMAAPSVVINHVKINNENIPWSDLVSKNTNEKTDSNSVVPNVTDEVNIFGRQLSDQERDSIRTKFADVSFEDITKWYPVPQKLVLPYYINSIGFDFNAIETGRNFLVKYQYLLSGYDKEWSPPAYNTSVSFGNIYEGTYTFMLKAQSPEGVWSEPLTYTFEVLPPWWRTWWMYTVYVLLSIGLILLFFWWNNRRIIYQKNKLQKQVVIATKQLLAENKKVEAQKKKTEETLKELKAAQGQLIQAEKMASLGELTAGIAHEIQNPLNFVNNFSEVNRELLAEMKDEISKGNIANVSEIANDVISNEEKINHHGKRADAIVKGMLQHSRTSSGQKELTNINVFADEYLRLSYHGLKAKEKDLQATIKIDYDQGLEKLELNRQDIGRVLLNIYNNAFYAVAEKAKALHSESPKNFEPTVSVSTKKIDGSPGRGGIQIRVKDNGNGIRKEILDKIFQPFFTTKPAGQGTGLGLSLSYDIIKAHQGEIKVHTMQGEGSEFIIELPL